MIGVGTDILKISNLAPGSLSQGDAFLRKTYTQAEVEQAAQREVPLYYYATRFAGKEAVFKSLNLGVEYFKLGEIEILNDEKGRPFVRLFGEVAEQARRQGVGRVLVSLSYDTDYAVAYASAMAD